MILTSSFKPRRWQGMTLAATVVATLALAAGGQALAPAPAAAWVVNDDPECGVPCGEIGDGGYPQDPYDDRQPLDPYGDDDSRWPVDPYELPAPDDRAALDKLVEEGIASMGQYPGIENEPADDRWPVNPYELPAPGDQDAWDRWFKEGIDSMGRYPGIDDSDQNGSGPKAPGGNHKSVPQKGKGGKRKAAGHGRGGR